MLIFTNKYVVALKKSAVIYLLMLFVAISCGRQGGNQTGVEEITEWELVTPDGSSARTVAVDTMELANPFVVYESKSDMYYMTGDGGYMWTSNDLRLWNGPFVVLDTDSCLWNVADCAVTAPEIHKHKGRYYYMASFENANGKHATCAVFVADRITGPFVPVNKDGQLLANEDIARHPTFCVDELNAGYMIYSDSQEQGGDLKIIRFTESLHKRMGEAYAMFSGADNALEAEKGASPIESPFLFVTETGMPGLLFTAYDGEESVVAVAYTINEMGHWLNGPWIAEPQPLMRGNVGGASLFTDYDGTMVMALHKDTLISDRNVKVPQFVKMDSQFEKLKKIGYYNF